MLEVLSFFFWLYPPEISGRDGGELKDGAFFFWMKWCLVYVFCYHTGGTCYTHFHLYPEDGWSKFLRNFDSNQPQLAVPHPRNPHSWSVNDTEHVLRYIWLSAEFDVRILNETPCRITIDFVFKSSSLLLMSVVQWMDWIPFFSVYRGVGGTWRWMF